MASLQETCNELGLCIEPYQWGSGRPEDRVYRCGPVKKSFLKSAGGYVFRDGFDWYTEGNTPQSSLEAALSRLTPGNG